MECRLLGHGELFDLRYPGQDDPLLVPQHHPHHPAVHLRHPEESVRCWWWVTGDWLLVHHSVRVGQGGQVECQHGRQGPTEGQAEGSWWEDVDIAGKMYSLSPGMTCQFNLTVQRMKRSRRIQGSILLGPQSVLSLNTTELYPALHYIHIHCLSRPCFITRYVSTQ